VVGTLALAAGCAPLSTLDPAGPAAGSIATLWWIMLGGSIVLTLLTLGLLASSYLHPGAITRFRPAVWIGGLGVAMPIAVITLLLVAALVQGEQLLPRATGDRVMRIDVTAHQFAWTFNYPDIEGARSTDNIVHLPVGVPVDFVVIGEDVIHSFWIPRLGGKIDAIPGHPNRVRLLADRPGRYNGVCAEFCGVGHAEMRFLAEAHEMEDFVAAVVNAP
jgi:cytochrome c oxidase subunit II